MTEAMGKHIRELRIKGLGYQTIAIVVGSTKETVRYYCKTHGLMGEAELARLNYEENLKRPENCKCCGAKLIRNRHSGKKLFCSNRCRQSWWQKHRSEIRYSDAITYDCTCKYCKREFKVYANPNRKYCSRECYIQDRFWTDHKVEPTEEEIKLRQEIADKKPTGTPVLKKITA